MSQTLRGEPRCPLTLSLPSRLDCAISANAAVGSTANRASLCIDLSGVCAIYAKYLRHLCQASVPPLRKRAAELIAQSVYFDRFCHYGIRNSNTADLIAK